LAQIFILNDLFVIPSARRQGVASRLLRAAADHGHAAGAIRLTLSTAVTNKEAQILYEREGWNRDAEFYVYHLVLKA
jgi:ribosomal protein S18 acetylase RimI-like enzyme